MKKRKFRFTYNKALFILWLCIFLGIAISNPVFLAPDYILNVMLRNIVEIGIVALPLTLIIIMGGIDLSVGNIMILSAVLGGIAATKYGDVAGIIVSMVVGLLCGLLNAFIIVKANISPMVATLATMYLYLGVARGISKGGSIYTYNFTTFMGNTSLAGVPLQIWIYILFALFFSILLSKTVAGRKLYAIGLNEHATEYAGVNIDRIKIIIYILCAVICAFASFIWLGRFTSVKYDAGINFNMKAITVVVLGGTSITGGFGSMAGTIIGTLIIATLNSGLTVMNIPIDVQTVVHGSVLIAALIANTIVNVRKRKSRIIKLDITDAA